MIDKREDLEPCEKLSYLPILICITVVLCICILCNTVISFKRMPAGSSIAATGSASVDFESDLIVWRGSFIVHGETLEDAYAKIQTNAELVRSYLLDQQIKEDEVLYGSVGIRRRTKPLYDEFGNLIGDTEDGYDLTQAFTVASENLDRVAGVSRDISQLIASGVELESRQPEYYCTTLESVKLELIEAASANAKQRIDLMAKQAGAKLKGLTTASTGVFQITACNSGTGDYGATGTLDISSRYKTAMITVKLNYTVK